ncbi:MAG TPA: single-stranded-DNA-specific exonuclease RecJ [Pseudobacteroides sp.]|uniref:single-stranded-DNA-specific exonuclease RecJ n=1 Tax=Pseudobacteroides sp. TaxID=1968840 RepID=UPI002F93D5B0
MFDKKWVCNDVEDAAVLELSQETQISTLLAKVFLSRGIRDKDYIKNFLNPSKETLHDPFLMKDMDKAVDRILKAVQDSERILIYGDYDVDGVTSTSVLYNFLSSLGASLDFFIPDRINDGYGITLDTAETIAKSGCPLVITVDCGVSAIKEVEYINSKGIDVIITDHHECREEIPDAFAVINPKRQDCTYPFKELCGVGIAYKLVAALCKRLELGDIHYKYLDLVTIGTIADVVPLVEENRVIVSNGFKIMKNTTNIGLMELLKLCNKKNENITTWMVAFVIAPRINAAGRIGDAKRAVTLFTTRDREIASDIAGLLDRENKARQDIESGIIDEVLNKIESDANLKNKKVMVISGEGWHHGVIGIVASKVTERYYKPCIILSCENGVCKGSGRSIEGLNMFMALSTCESLLDNYGGHEMAAGLTLKEENLEEFNKLLNTFADNNMKEEELVPKINIDVRLSKNEINLKSISEIEMMSPFGVGNPNPVFLYENIRIADLRAVGNNKHLKAVFEDQGLTVDAIGFNMGNLIKNLANEDFVDVVCSLDKNTWNSMDKAQLVLKDIRYSKEIVMEQKYFSSLEKCVDYTIENVGSDYSSNQSDDTVFQNLEQIDNRINYLINDDKNTTFLVNSLESAKKIKILHENLQGCIKKKLNICYTCFNDQDNTGTTLIINPDIEHIDKLGRGRVVFYGAWTVPGYMEMIYNRIKAYAAECIFILAKSDELAVDIVLKRQDIEAVYKFIRSHCTNNILFANILVLARKIALNYKISMNIFKLKKSIEILDELNLLKIEYKNDYHVSIVFNNNIKEKTSLDNSGLYRKLQVYNNQINIK